MRLMRVIFGPLLICAVGVGATALPASAATAQPAHTAVSDHPYHHPYGYGGPLSPAGLFACAEQLGLPNPGELVWEVVQEGALEFTLRFLKEEDAEYFLLGAQAFYVVYDFWFNCVAPYLPVPSSAPPLQAPPSAPSSPVAPTPPFYTLGGGDG